MPPGQEQALFPSTPESGGNAEPRTAHPAGGSDCTVTCWCCPDGALRFRRCRPALAARRQAMSKYGSDKPDLRFGLEFLDVTQAVAGCTFRWDGEGASCACCARGCHGFVRPYSRAPHVTRTSRRRLASYLDAMQPSHPTHNHRNA